LNDYIFHAVQDSLEKDNHTGTTLIYLLGSSVENQKASIAYYFAVHSFTFDPRAKMILV